MFTEWSDIAAYVGTRDKGQCQSKWKQIQAPKKGAHEWTPAEHNLFKEIFHRMPFRWRDIAMVC